MSLDCKTMCIYLKQGFVRGVWFIKQSIKSPHVALLFHLTEQLSKASAPHQRDEAGAAQAEGQAPQTQSGLAVASPWAARASAIPRYYNKLYNRRFLSF